MPESSHHRDRGEPDPVSGGDVGAGRAGDKKSIQPGPTQRRPDTVRRRPTHTEASPTLRDGPHGHVVASGDLGVTVPGGVRCGQLAVTDRQRRVSQWESPRQPEGSDRHLGVMPGEVELVGQLSQGGPDCLALTRAVPINGRWIEGPSQHPEPPDGGAYPGGRHSQALRRCLHREAVVDVAGAYVVIAERDHPHQCRSPFESSGGESAQHGVGRDVERGGDLGARLAATGVAVRPLRHRRQLAAVAQPDARLTQHVLELVAAHPGPRSGLGSRQPRLLETHDVVDELGRPTAGPVRLNPLRTSARTAPLDPEAAQQQQDASFGELMAGRELGHRQPFVEVAGGQLLA